VLVISADESGMMVSSGLVARVKWGANVRIRVRVRRGMIPRVGMERGFIVGRLV
jgi:hypothetical protein